MKKSNIKTIKTEYLKEFEKLNDSAKIDRISAMLWTVKHDIEGGKRNKQGNLIELPYLADMTKGNILEYVAMGYAKLYSLKESFKDASLSKALWYACFYAVRDEYKAVKKSVSALVEYDSDGNPLFDLESFSNNHYGTERTAVMHEYLTESIKRKAKGKRDKDILYLIAQGLEYEEISDRLNISVDSIKSAVKRMKKR